MLCDPTGTCQQTPREIRPSDSEPPPGDNSCQNKSWANSPNSSSAASSSTVRYLQTYYRHTSAEPITGYSGQDLVQHYFKYVCPLFSCFDSSINKFRDLVSKNWSTSATLSLSIQSMSAAHLANYYSSLAPLGIRKRSQAWISLQRDLHHYRVQRAPLEIIIMNLMLLGLSASWHQASNLGMQYLHIARSLIRHQIEEGDDGGGVEFFQKGLMYWEMLVSFVDPVPIAPIAGRLILAPPDDPLASPNPIMPHPWAGVVTEVHFALAEIGRVLRRQRSSRDSMTTDAAQPPDNSFSASFDLDWATDLSKFLHAVTIPPVEKIGDFHDKRTSKDDLVRLASAYRLVGILEIYSIFPHLAHEHIQMATTIDGFNFGCMDQDVGNSDSVAKSLPKLAKFVLFSILKPITIESGSSRLLPLLYVIIANHLLLSETRDESDVVLNDDDEIQPRTLIDERMLEMSRKYPQRPQLQMLDLTRVIWHRLDGESMDVHWLQVMHQKGMQTLMGWCCCRPALFGTVFSCNSSIQS